MKTKLLLILTLITSSTLFAQKRLPIIKATSTQVDIRDGRKLNRNVWRIVPEEKLDVYVTF